MSLKGIIYSLSDATGAKFALLPPDNSSGNFIKVTQRPKDYPTGIALNNMIRQLGGAFGIAIANNYIAKQYAQHRVDLVSNMQNGAQQTANFANNIIARTGDAATVANNKALAIMSLNVDKQAYYLTYLDTFRLIGIFFIIILPFIFFLRTKKKSIEELNTALKAAKEAH